MGIQLWPHCVNRLYSAEERNINRSFRLVCFTNDTKEIRSEVDVYLLPEINSKALDYLTKPYKIGLFASNIGDLQSHFYTEFGGIPTTCIACLQTNSIRNVKL